MAQEIREVMTQDVVALPTDTSLADASRAMRERDIGDVLVVDGERLTGIVTDRDIVIRAIAEDRPPGETTLGELATGDVTSLSPEDSSTTRSGSCVITRCGGSPSSRTDVPSRSCRSATSRSSGIRTRRSPTSASPIRTSSARRAGRAAQIRSSKETVAAGSRRQCALVIEPL